MDQYSHQELESIMQDADNQYCFDCGKGFIYPRNS
jgi:hypothetical protein